MIWLTGMTELKNFEIGNLVKQYIICCIRCIKKIYEIKNSRLEETLYYISNFGSSFCLDS